MHPLQSEQIDQLMSALALVHTEQGVLIEKDSKGFKGTYASQDIIIDTIKDRCIPYGLVLNRRIVALEEKQYLETQLYHVPSKQFIKSLSMLHVDPHADKPDHVWGSSMTYQSRYAALGIVGMVATDDPADNDGWKHGEKSASPIERTMNVIESNTITEKQMAFLKSKLHDKPHIGQLIKEQEKVQSLSQIPKNNFNAVLALFDTK
jgi:hypothetical protein